MYYRMLLAVWGIAILWKLTIGFHNKYWIWITGATVCYLFLKDVFTGVKWSQKLVRPQAKKPTPMQEKLSRMSYEAFVQSLPPMPEKEKQGYIELANCCVAESLRSELISFISSMKDMSMDEDYGSNLNYIMEELDKRTVAFLAALDHKAAVQELEWRLNNALRQHYSLEIDIHHPGNHFEAATVSRPGVFEHYDQLLRANGLQIGFADTRSDEYVIIVHKVADKARVAAAIQKTGYAYFEKLQPAAL